LDYVFHIKTKASAYSFADSNKVRTSWSLKTEVIKQIVG